MLVDFGTSKGLCNSQGVPGLLDRLLSGVDLLEDFVLLFGDPSLGVLEVILEHTRAGILQLVCDSLCGFGQFLIFVIIASLNSDEVFGELNESLDLFVERIGKQV